jgi:DNA-binding transcriptional MerR regulator
MFYTVKKLAKLSGVSVRTLHYYDEIGLLRPAYYGENKYRYYDKKQLLVLQQILFYRQLGFSLGDIQKILKCDSFNTIEALESHRKILSKALDRTKVLIKTIDKTIAHLRGKTTMKDEELYYGFDSEQQQQYESDLVAKGIVGQDFMREYKTKMSHWTELDKENFLKEGQEINHALITAMNNQLDPGSKEVQAIIKRHHKWVGWNPTKEKYIALTQLYQTPEFKKFYDQHHPDLLQFIVSAMKIFAQNDLS